MNWGCQTTLCTDRPSGTELTINTERQRHRVRRYDGPLLMPGVESILRQFVSSVAEAQVKISLKMN